MDSLKSALYCSVLLLPALFLAGCMGDAEDAGESTASVTLAPVVRGPQLEIQNRPRLSVNVGEVYDFTPQVRGASAEAVSFSIIDKPDWVSFDPLTGRIVGAPGDKDVGESQSMLLVVRAGEQQAMIGPFSIHVAPRQQARRHNGWGGMPAR